MKNFRQVFLFQGWFCIPFLFSVFLFCCFSTMIRWPDRNVKSLGGFSGFKDSLCLSLRSLRVVPLNLNEAIINGSPTTQTDMRENNMEDGVGEELIESDAEQKEKKN